MRISIAKAPATAPDTTVTDTILVERSLLQSILYNPIVSYKGFLSSYMAIEHSTPL